MAISGLPNEIWVRIFENLTPQDLSRVKCVCQIFFQIACDQRLYIRSLNELRECFPLFVVLDDNTNFNAYQKTTRAAKRICLFDARARGKEKKGDNAIVDIATIAPYDQELLNELSARQDHEVYLICHSLPISNRILIVKSLLQSIQEKLDRHFMPRYNLEGMLQQALKRYIQHLSINDLKMILNQLSRDEIFALIKYLYPLRFDLRSWHRFGLDLNLRNSTGDGLAHLVTRQMDFIQMQRKFNTLDLIVRSAAFIDGKKLITLFIQHDFLTSVKDLTESNPFALSEQIKNVEDNVNELTKSFERLDLNNAAEVLQVAIRCEDLIRNTQSVARSPRNREQSIKNPCQDKKVVESIKEHIFSPNFDMALSDLCLLKDHGQIDVTNHGGETPWDLIMPYRVRYSDKRWSVISEICEPPLRSSL